MYILKTVIIIESSIKYNIKVVTAYLSKVNQMGSPDLEFRPKNRIMDFFYLESSNRKILLKEISDFDCFFNFWLKYFLIHLDQKFEFLGAVDFSFDLLCLTKIAIL